MRQKDGRAKEQEGKKKKVDDERIKGCYSKMIFDDHPELSIVLDPHTRGERANDRFGSTLTTIDEAVTKNEEEMTLGTVRRNSQSSNPSLSHRQHPFPPSHASPRHPDHLQLHPPTRPLRPPTTRNPSPTRAATTIPRSSHLCTLLIRHLARGVVNPEREGRATTLLLLRWCRCRYTTVWTAVRVVCDCGSI
jgi:hypothetical protein